MKKIKKNLPEGVKYKFGIDKGVKLKIINKNVKKSAK